MVTAASSAPAETDLPPLAADVFAADKNGPYLIGGRRKSDGKIVFPLPHGPERQLYDAIPLAREGALWSYTVQRFRPKTPSYMGADDDKTFKPFVLGYVELKDQVIVETRIEIDTPQRLKIGLPMKLVIVPFPRLDGKRTAAYAFTPI